MQSAGAGTFSFPVSSLVYQLWFCWSEILVIMVGILLVRQFFWMVLFFSIVLFFRLSPSYSPLIESSIAVAYGNGRVIIFNLYFPCFCKKQFRLDHNFKLFSCFQVNYSHRWSTLVYAGLHWLALPLWPAWTATMTALERIFMIFS